MPSAAEIPLHRRAWALGCHTRIRAGSPRQRPRARPCRSRSPDLDPFVIRRSQTTERKHTSGRWKSRGIGSRQHLRTPTLAGDRPPRYGKKRHVTVGRGPVPRHRSCARPYKSGSPDPNPFVIRRSQTTEGSPTKRNRDQEGSPILTRTPPKSSATVSARLSNALTSPR